MATRISGKTSTWRLRLGESVLSAARAIDTSPVKARLEDFGRAHHEYAEAQRNGGRGAGAGRADAARRM